MKATMKNGHFFVVNAIARGCEGKKENGKQVRSDKGLNIVHQNIRSLWRKCEELGILLATEIYNTKVLCFTEHWLIVIKYRP